MRFLLDAIGNSQRPIRFYSFLFAWQGVCAVLLALHLLKNGLRSLAVEQQWAILSRPEVAEERRGENINLHRTFVICCRSRN